MCKATRVESESGQRGDTLWLVTCSQRALNAKLRKSELCSVDRGNNGKVSGVVSPYPSIFFHNLSLRHSRGCMTCY